METDKEIKAIEIVQTSTPRLSLQNTFADHGNEIEEIISKRMPWFVRWGTVLFLVFLLFIALICWFINYPEIVTTGARLNSVNPPRAVITKTEGKIIQIAIKENEEVKSGRILAYMESIANPATVAKLLGQVDSMNQLLAEQRTDELVSFYPGFKGSQEMLNNLGELQSSYQTFIQSFTSFKDYLHSGFYLRKREMLRIDMAGYQKQHQILVAQQQLLTEDLALSKKTFDANESLAQDKVIAPFEYRTEKSKLISKQLSIPQVKASIVSNESQQHEKTKEIAELENQIIVQKNSFIQALQTLKSQVQAWQQKYVLKAPVDGIISFNGFFTENQEIKTGQSLFYVQPFNTAYFLEMLIPQYNFGKVKTGQSVLLKFQAYPYEQFGSVTGKIEYISSTPTDSGFLAKVSLPGGLQTNYNKTLQYQNGLYAQAEIITENMRLLQRFYYNIAKQLHR